jgi:hypothetical protein
MKNKRFLISASWFISISLFAIMSLFPTDFEGRVRAPLLVAAHDSSNNNDQSGLAKLWADLVKGVKCFIEQYKAGSEPLEHVASYTRHKKEGMCRTHVGNFVHEYDARSCPDHVNAQVKQLLDICWRAVTYHLPTGEIYVVEADPTQGKRMGVRGGPYAQRVTEKPQVQTAQVCKVDPTVHTQRLATSKPLYYIRLLDSSNRTLIECACFEPLQKLETQEISAYELSNHILNKVQHDVDMNELKTAVEVDDWSRHRQDRHDLFV